MSMLNILQKQIGGLQSIGWLDETSREGQAKITVSVSKETSDKSKLHHNQSALHKYVDIISGLFFRNRIRYRETTSQYIIYL